MASEELEASWQRTEEHLREALRHQKLPADARSMALDFIDHNEFGEAFEWIVGVLINRHLAVDPLARAPLGAAAEEMQLDGDPMWLALCRSA